MDRIEFEFFCRDSYFKIGKIKDDLQDKNYGRAEKSIVLLMNEIENRLIIVMKDIRK